MKIVQAVLFDCDLSMPVESTLSLDEFYSNVVSERGIGGFGSTDKKDEEFISDIIEETIEEKQDELPGDTTNSGDTTKTKKVSKKGK